MENKNYLEGMTADGIRKKAEEHIKTLQQVCQHPDTHWVQEAWAPGHMTGRVLKMCKVCEKIIETRGGNTATTFKEET